MNGDKGTDFKEFNKDYDDLVSNQQVGKIVVRIKK